MLQVSSGRSWILSLSVTYLKEMITCPVDPLVFVNGGIFPLNNSINFVAGSIVALVKSDRLSKSLFLQARGDNIGVGIC